MKLHGGAVLMVVVITLVISQCTASSVVVGNCDVSGIEARYDSLASAIRDASDDEELTVVVCPGRYNGTNNVALSFTRPIRIIAASRVGIASSNNTHDALDALDVLFDCNGSWGWAFHSNGSLEGISVSGCNGALAVGMEVLPMAVNGSYGVRLLSHAVTVSIKRCKVFRSQGMFAHELEDAFGAVLHMSTGDALPPVALGEVMVGSGSVLHASESQIVPLDHNSLEEVRNAPIGCIVALDRAQVHVELCVVGLERTLGRFLVGVARGTFSISQTAFADTAGGVYIARREVRSTPSALHMREVSFDLSTRVEFAHVLDAWNTNGTLEAVEFRSFQFGYFLIRVVDSDVSMAAIRLYTLSDGVTIDSIVPTVMIAVDSVVRLKNVVTFHFYGVRFLHASGEGSWIEVSNATVETYAEFVTVECGARALLRDVKFVQVTYLDSVDTDPLLQAISCSDKRRSIIEIRGTVVSDSFVDSSFARISNSLLQIRDSSIAALWATNTPLIIVDDTDALHATEVEIFNSTIETAYASQDVSAVDIESPHNVSVRVFGGTLKLGQSLISSSGNTIVIYDGVKFESVFPVQVRPILTGAPDGSVLEVRNSEFANFFSNAAGVHLVTVAENQVLSLSGCKFRDIGMQDGAIHSVGRVVIFDAVISQCSRTFARLYGGSCEMEHVNITSNVIIGNESFIVARNSTLTVRNASGARNAQGTTSPGLFSVLQGGNVVIEGSSFEDNQAGFGSIVYAKHGSRVVLSNSSIGGSNSLVSGGVAYVEDGSFEIENCMISRAISDKGGVMAMYGKAQVTIRNCVVYKCSAADTGGFATLGDSSNLHADGLSIVSSTATRGGVFFVSDRADVAALNCHFILGRAQYGGVLMVAKGTVTSIEFSEVVSVGAIGVEDGGVIHACASDTFCDPDAVNPRPMPSPSSSSWNAPSVVIVFEHCTINGRLSSRFGFARTRSLGVAAGTRTSPVLIAMRNLTLEDQVGSLSGTNFESRNYVEVELTNITIARTAGCFRGERSNFVFSNIHADTWVSSASGTGIECSFTMDEGWLSITDSAFQQVQPIVVRRTECFLDNVMFTRSRFDEATAGFALWIDQGSTNMSRCHFEGLHGTRLRAAVMASGEGELVVRDSSVSKCKCWSESGSPVQIWGGMSVVISNCTFLDNVGSAGALTHAGCQGHQPGPLPTATCIRDSSLLIEHSLFADNVASRNGGAVHLENSRAVELSRVCMERNSAGEAGSAGLGGAMSIENARVLVANSVLRDNKASLKGGGIAVLSSALDLRIENTIVSNNSAMVGGGLAVFESNSSAGAIVYDSVITGNNAIEGSVLYVSSVLGQERNNFPVTFVNSTIEPGVYASGGLVAGDASELRVTVLPESPFPGDTVDVDLHVLDSYGNVLLGPNVRYYVATVNISAAGNESVPVGGGAFSDFGDFQTIPLTLAVSGGVVNISTSAAVPDRFSTLACALSLMEGFTYTPLEAWEEVYVHPYCALGEFMSHDNKGSHCIPCEADEYSFQSVCKACPIDQVPCVDTEKDGTFRRILAGYWVSPPEHPAIMYRCSRADSCIGTDCWAKSEQIACKTDCAAGYEGRLCARCKPRYYGVGFSCYECVVAATLGYPLVHIICQTVCATALWMLNITPLWLPLFAALLVVASLLGWATRRYDSSDRTDVELLQDIDSLLTGEDTPALEEIENEHEIGGEASSPLIATGAVESLLFFLQANQIAMGGFFNKLFDFKLPLQLGGIDCLLETTSFVASFVSLLSLPCIIFTVITAVALVAYVLETHLRSVFVAISADVPSQMAEYGEMHAPIDSAFADAAEAVDSTPLAVPSRLRHWMWKALSLMLLLLSVLYFEITGAVLQVLSCEYDEGLEKHFMTSEPDVQCYDFSISSEWGLLFFLMVIGFVIYAVGIPTAWIALLGFLWNGRQLFSIDAQTSFGFLFTMYRTELWWWHIVTIIRLIVLEAASVFFERTESESALYNGILVISLALHTWVKPYKREATNFVAMASMVVLLVGYNTMTALSGHEGVEYVVLALILFMMGAFLIVLALPPFNVIKTYLLSLRKRTRAL